MSVIRPISDLVEPVPEALVEGKPSKEKQAISRGYRAFTRLKEQESNLALQAHLRVAPMEQKIPKPHRRIPFRDPHATVKVNIPKALLMMKTADPSSLGSAFLSPSSGLRPKKTLVATTGKLDKGEQLSTVELKKPIKNSSPSERIALYYTPSANVRTSGRNAQMRSYEYQISFRNVEPPMPAAPDLREEDRGIHGKDPALSHFIPLEEFDNTEFETLSGEEWAKRGGPDGTPARSRFFAEDSNEEVWAPCRVVDYERESSTFHIIWNHNGKPKAVKRLNIIFDDEDHAVWQERVNQALELRAQAEAEIRLNLYIEGMEQTAITPVNEDQVDNILALVASEFPLQHLHVVERCISELRSTYSYGLKRAVHQYRFKNPEEQARLKPLGFEPEEEMLPPSLDELLGTIDTPSPNFHAAREHIGENLFETHALLYDTLHTIHSRWHQFEENLLCDTLLKGVMLPCELHVFEEIQNKTGSHVSDRLREDWASNVHTTISNDLDTHFNFYEEKIERYKSSRMYRFFRMVNIVMTSQLRQLLVASIKTYTDFLQKYRVILPPDFDVDDDKIEELPEDNAERLYWEGVAATVQARRDEEARQRALAVAKPKKKKQEKTEDVLESEPEQEGAADEPKEIPALEFEFEKLGDYSARIIEMTRVPNGLEPLFVVRLISNGDAVMYSPLLEEVEDKVKAVFDNFFAYTENIKGVGDLLFPLLQLPVFLLHPVEHQEPVVMEGKEILHRVLLENMQGPRQLQRMYQSFEYILKIEIDTLIDTFSQRKPPPTQDDFDKTLERLFRDMDRIRTRTLDEVKFELVKVDTDGIKGSLLRKANEVAYALLDLLASQLNDQVREVSNRYEQIDQNIRVEPKTPEELHSLTQYIDGVEAEMSELNSMFNDITAGNELLLKYRYITDVGDFEMYWNAYEWPKKLNLLLEDITFKLKEYKNAFQLELRENCTKLTEDIAVLQTQVEQLALLGDDARYDENHERIKSLEEKIKRYQQDILLYNRREELFKMPATQWSHIRDIKQLFEPYQVLWEVTYNYHTYIDDISTVRPFETLKADEVEMFVNDWTRKLGQVSKKLKDEGPMHVCSKIRDMLDKFRPNLPLIKALRNNLQATHWKQISKRVGTEVNTENGKTLNELLKTGLLAHIDYIEEVAELAAKTNMLENKLTQMENDWKKITFDLEPYPNGTHKLKASEAIQQMLDEHIMRTQGILGNPFTRQAGTVEARAKQWEKTLSEVHDILDEWFKCQTTWAYLEPIFSSADISRALEQEAAKFSQVNDSWAQIMHATVNANHVLSRCQDPDLLDTLRRNNADLEWILKKLMGFLEKKRKVFPRFYFISNEELLQILSDSKSPYLVQPYLFKCFEGIKSVRFEDHDDITAMESAEGELVPFCRKVNPADHENLVEKWLLDVEAVMCDSIKDHLRRARDDYVKYKKRVDFLLKWPGQVVIAICSMYWTAECEQNMLIPGGMEKYFETCTEQMNDLVCLVRDRGLNPVERFTLEALVVIDVHAKDIVAELVKKQIDSVTAFDWLAQLRYYWRDGNMRVEQINASLAYGYEYLGNTGRLVITQLTDRCYRTLMGAIDLNYGGAPEGPAGTGKTETVKDLAKALAKQCVVYNCSDQISFKDMAKLFKGLSQAGAWSCFDEFNRIEIQVLSVIAQQVATIQEAIAQKAVEFRFEGDDIKLKLGCAIFITMNPGYAGRSNLPDNLKALFRPVAMMVPNYALIGEIQLYSYGFLSGKVLSNKITATYRLCSEQLSSQDHYDYGMRAVKAVLTAAGRLKRQYPDEKEEIIMLRSIQDVNLPKFLHQDVELFNGIVSDLFPGVQLPEPQYDNIKGALAEMGHAANLQMTDYFYVKCLQTYEMICVRHGMMLVGMSISGKTASLRTLAKALTVMHQRKLEEKTRIITMNPKAVSMAQLYGKVDRMSGEWTDGVLSKIFRTAASDNTPDRKWLVLDGPVDAVWIENMNTVLDDNKKLCLQNGDLIPMSKSMNMIFEVQDLTYASPATVSRCGMVYFEPDALGWMCQVDSYFEALPALITETEQYVTTLRNLVDWLVEPCLEFIRKHCATAIPQNATVAVSSFLTLFESFMGEFRDDSKHVDYEEREVVAKIEGFFIFSLLWTVGGCLGTKHRIAFNTFLNETVSSGHKKNPAYKLQIISLPDRRSLYEVFFSCDKGEPAFHDWIELAGDYKISPDAQYHEVIVPTTDTERYTYIMNTLIENNHPCLLVGDTGTGKTIMAKSLLFQRLDKEHYVINMIQFSAQTSANQTQELIDSRTERRRKGIYGPPLNRRIIIFLDDLNMPQLEEYGAQPPIELLRQWMDHGGWYNHTKDNVDFRELIDTQFLAAMGPPGGGRNHITPRYTRHFNTISVPSFDEATMKKIFGSLLEWIISRGFPSSFRGSVPSIVQATVQTYETLVEKMKPTPEKSHYTFNLRDVSKVFQGIYMAVPERIQEMPMLYRLWAHEMFRALADRFVEQTDTEKFISIMDANMQENFRVGFRSVVPDSVLFADFANDARAYVEIEEMGGARRALEETLDEYNDRVRTGQMNLVIFNYVIEHVARICRILKQPFGHALLVGVGGSGRSSCTKLAAKCQDYDYFTVSMTKEYRRQDFMDDIKKVMLKCGRDNVPTAFTLMDTQITDDSFLEDVSSLLNTGEIPNLFSVDDEELQNASTILREAQREAGRIADPMLDFFLERCRVNLHIVLCFSPVGKTLRDRLRKFPSLVNCTTIDWFREWPEEGLRGVAEGKLANVDVTEEQRHSIANCFVYFQETIREMGIVYLEEARQKTYVTPTSYLELLETFNELLGKKRTELTQARSRYDNGLDQLKKTEEEVELLQQELEIMKPQLKRKAKETEELITVISSESEEAEKIRAKVAIEEAAANKTAAKSKAIKDECEDRVQKAMPRLEEARAAASSIDVVDLRELKALGKPPEKVKFVLEGVCNLLGEKPKPVRDPQTGKLSIPWWDHAKLHVMTDKFKDNLLSFDVNTCSEDQIRDTSKYIAHKDFDAKTIASSSKACVGIVKYVVASVDYFQENKSIKPLQADQAIAEREYEVAMQTLKLKMDELAIVDDQLNKKRAHLERVKKEKQELEDKVQDTDTKLVRAKKLITGLGGEKTRYLFESERLAGEFAHVLGDVVLSAGCVAYFGPFQNKYRQTVLKQWTAMLKQYNIPFSPEFSLDKFLGDPIKIQDWQLKKLPADPFSIDNAVIMTNARRWPLFIDPQEQANQWIRRMTEGTILVVRPSESDLAAAIGEACRNGKSVLLENVEEDLDPALDNILMKRFERVGSTWKVSIGEVETPIEPDKFNLYITTKLPRPHYRPEVSTKVTLINMLITQQGLQDQLLQEVMKSERAELEARLRTALTEAAENRATLKKTEDTILGLLSQEGNILESESAILELDRAKAVSDKVALRQKDVEQTEKTCEKQRSQFIPVAHVGAALFFCVVELANIDPMYQYSLQFYISLFNHSLAESEKSDEPAERVEFIIPFFKQNLYRNVCRSLFAKDQLLFSFIMTLKLYETENTNEIRWLLMGGFDQDKGLTPNPCKSWLSDLSWKYVWRASTQVPSMAGLDKLIVAHQEELQEFFQTTDPLNFKFPGDLGKMEGLQKLIVFRCLRTDSIVPAVTDYVRKRLGDEYVSVPLADLEIVLAELEGKPHVPVIFVLSPGADPNAEFDRVAEIRGMNNKRVKKLSLGQGQDEPAKQRIDEGKKMGHWVLLQNCHLFADFMPKLARIIEEFGRAKEPPHPEFRLWLTSLPSDEFPVSVLQNGVKLVQEPPKGLKNNLIRSYKSDPIADTKNFFYTCNKPEPWRKLLFGLCFFHSLVQERRGFGPLGWNIPYEFNDTDMRISVRQLLIFTNTNNDVPYEAITYLAGECNYGGRVTDDWDRRTLMAMLSMFYTQEILSDHYRFAPAASEYYAPPHGDYESYIEYIEKLPFVQNPEVFGLHKNADITKDEREARMLMEATLATQPRESTAKGGASLDPKTVVYKLAQETHARIRPPFDTEAVSAKYPLTYEQSMNTVLLQELIRYNRLIKVVRSSLADLQKAIKGEVVMSADLENVYTSMYDGKVPKLWNKRSFPSLKPFGSYINDLCARLEMFETWIEKGPPSVFWISGFYFTHSFLTGVMQNYARKYQIEIDTLKWDFTVMHDPHYDDPPEDGCYIKGLFLEGAGWDHDNKLVCESKPKELFLAFPVIYLLPQTVDNISTDLTYDCPTYMTTDRRGVLATTGHSTNFVMIIKLPRSHLHSENHWVKRGAALFTQLEY